MDGSYPAAVASSVLGGGPGGVLTGAAEAVAASLVDGTSLDAGRAPLRDLRDALLQEHADAGPDAEQRCAKLRTSFAQAVLMALAKRPQAAALLKGDALPHIPVEVRGTARRTMTQAVFSVGRAAECDIQMYGDVTLSRLQLIVISLPKAMVVVDAWSSGGTRVVRRSSPVAAALPSSVPQNRLAFVLAPDETAILLIGQKTTLTLGPMLPGTKAMAVPGAVPAAVAQAAAAAQAPAAAPQTTLKTTTAAPEARAVPHSVAANVTPAGQAAPKVAVARVVAEPFAPSPARSAAPAPHGPTDASVPQADRQPDSTASRHTPASLGRHDSSPATAQDSSSSGGREVPGVPASSAGQSAPGACRKAFARSANVVRAAVRMQLSAATRKRLVARIRSAVRSQLLTVGQGTELEERMRGDANSVDEIRDILDGLGIPPAPQEPNYVLRPGSVVRLQGLEASTELNGTTGTVEEWLPDRGRWAVRLIGGVTKALKPDNLTLVADPEPASSRAGRCPRGSCSVPEEPRRQAECACGGPPFCSKCGGAPYHYHADCSRQEPLRVRWLEWLGGGREAYQRVCRQANREAAAHKRAIKEAMQITARKLQKNRLFTSHVLLGLKYAGASFCQALAILMIGLPACALPFALLLDRAGGAMVSRQRPDHQDGHATLLPMGWSAETVNILDDVPYYMFFACNSGMVACLITSICTLFVAEWRGRSYLLWWPLRFSAFCIFAVASSNMLRIWLLAEGHLRSSMYQVCTIGVYLVCLVCALCIALSGEAAGSRLQLSGRCLVAYAPFVLIHWAMSFVVAAYFRSPNFVFRLLCLIALQGLRVVGIEVTICASGGIPGCPPQARVLPLWMINMFTLGAQQIMQTSSPDLGSTAVVYVILALIEIGRHKRYLTTGETELAAWLSRCRPLITSAWTPQPQVHHAEVHHVGVVPNGAWAAGADRFKMPSNTAKATCSEKRLGAADSMEAMQRLGQTDSMDFLKHPGVTNSTGVQEQPSSAHCANRSRLSATTSIDPHKLPTAEESVNAVNGLPSAAENQLSAPQFTDANSSRPSAPDSTDADTQPNAADARKQLLVELVVATNLTEILMTATVATVFLIAKLNPAHFASGPWPWQKTLWTAAIALLCELASDFLAVMWAARSSLDVPRLYQITSTASWTHESPWRNAALCFVAMLIALVSVAYLAGHLCPRPQPGTNTLHVIGVCS